MSISFTRRGFMLGAGAVSAAILTSRRGFSLEPAGVSIDASKEIGLIRPELHGQFAEHLGSCIYGGLWVGKDSPVPNIDGYRRQAVEYLKGLVPVLRWPGGCFADDYHWRDGVGPVARRPKTVNISWGNNIENNSFGTHEFIGLCRLIAAQPYLSANVGSGTPEEMRDWMEYCNYPKGSSLSDLRAANGARRAFQREVLGRGQRELGMRRPDDRRRIRHPVPALLQLRARFRRDAPVPGGLRAERQQQGVDPEVLGQHRGPGAAFPRVSPCTSTPVARTSPPNSRPPKWSSSSPASPKSRRPSSSSARCWTPTTRRSRSSLLLDEWGVWDRMVPEEQTKYGRLFQQITMRSAVAAALGLNVIHRQAGKLAMTNIAQIVNVLHSMLLTDGPQCVRTTTYYVYQMTKAHLSQTSIAVAVEKPEPVGLSVSASRQGGELTLTLVNPKPDAGMTVNCSLAGRIRAQRHRADSAR